MILPNEVEDLLRQLSPRVLGTLVRRYGDFSASEDAVQEALIAAAKHWPKDGVPDNPRGWLVHAAVHRMTDSARQQRARREREEHAALREPPPPVASEIDDSLILLFLCCHRALTPASAIALTLRAVGGLTTAEIAGAYLVPEATMAQRISRAKQKIRSSGLPFELPRVGDYAENLRSVLHVLYLIFNEGYTSSGGADLHRSDLSGEAIRLTRAVHQQLPDQAEVTGLLALMLLNDARRPARTTAAGDLIPLDQQDRSRWDAGKISEGVALVVEALARGAVGEYQLQAAIAGVHDEARTTEDTDWPQILGLYTLLSRMSDNPMVLLNHAIATAMVLGPAAGLVLLDPLDAQLGGHHRLEAVRGHLYERLGDVEAAARHYRTAARRTANLPEQRYLIAQAARLRR